MARNGSLLTPAALTLIACLALAANRPPQLTTNPAIQAEEGHPMQLGNFSVSLAVKDLEASRAFYAKLGFEPIGGNADQNWLILQNDHGGKHERTTIGLFQGMFERNIMTFNPGWTSTSETVDSFQDVRELQALLDERGLTLTTRADPDETGPASLALIDPDGNPILIDQHVPRPAD